MSYRQLTERQRYQISALLSEEFSQREIAKKLKILRPRPSIESCDVTTICAGHMTLKKLKSVR